MPFTDHTGLAGAGGFAGYHAVTIYCTPPSAFTSALVSIPTPSPTPVPVSTPASTSAYTSTVLPHPCLYLPPSPTSAYTYAPSTVLPHPCLHPRPHPHTPAPVPFTLHYITHVHLYTRPRIRACLCLHSCFRACSYARVRVRLSTHLCTRAYAFHRTSASPSAVFPHHPHCTSLSPSAAPHRLLLSHLRVSFYHTSVAPSVSFLHTSVSPSFFLIIFHFY